jgi:hypothetical protein
LLHSDGTVFSRSFSEEYPQPELNTTWLRLAETVQSLSLCRVNPQRTLWTFEHAQLQFVLRPDGTALGLVTVAYPMPADPKWVESLVQEFLGL